MWWGEKVFLRHLKDRWGVLWRLFQRFWYVKPMVGSGATDVNLKERYVFMHVVVFAEKVIVQVSTKAIHTQRVLCAWPTLSHHADGDLATVGNQNGFKWFRRGFSFITSLNCQRT
jgi:hypothetical protein